MSPPPSNLKKVAFLFPGTGSQHIGMGAGLWAEYPEIRKNISLLESRLGYELKNYMFHGPDAALFPGLFSDIPTVFAETTAVLGLAIAKSLAEKTSFPDFAAGRSFGEFTASSFAGFFSPLDCINAIKKTIREGQKICVRNPSSLVTVYGPGKPGTAWLLKEMKKAGHSCELAIFYERLKVSVLGTERKSLDTLRKLLAKKGWRSSVSREPGAFHTSLFRDLSSDIPLFLEKAALSDPKIPVFLNCDAEKCSRKKALASKIALGVSKRVYWQETLENMLAAGVRVFVEIGPGIMLTEFICELPRDAVALKTDNAANFAGTRDFLKKNAKK